MRRECEHDLVNAFAGNAGGVRYAGVCRPEAWIIGIVNANDTTTGAQGQSVHTIPARVHRDAQIEDGADGGFGASET